PRALPPRAALDAWDLVVLSNVARAALTDGQLAALEGFVRDGGGLLVAGGADAYGSGGWRDSRLAPLLPVLLDLPEREDEASLALALVVDKSGSMAGPKLDLTKEAARATADALPPADLIGVVTFDTRATPVVRLQRASGRARIAGDIARIRASGGTNILAGLREAFDELAPARARKKHIILLSDGASPAEGIPELVDDAAAQRITISTVGVGDGADNSLLKSIASRGGGRFYQTRDPASLPRIFTRETSEVSRGSVVEAPTPARPQKRADLLAGVPLDRAPPLGGYTVTRARPRAELILAAPNGAPLLARWQIGLGQVTAWTSDVEPRWSAAWMRWPGFAKFWAQVARATMRRRAPHHFHLRATPEGDHVALAVEAVGADDKFLTGLGGAVDVTAVSPAGAIASRRTAALTETAPGHYETTVDVADGTGALLFAATLRSADGTPAADATTSLSWPFAPEVRPAAPDGGASPGLALLTAAAARTGGRVLTNPLDVLAPEGPRPETRRSIRTPILVAATALFVLDVLLRRVRLDTVIRPRRRIV
ncbi:MAG TPA: VWA domain-containing protein, partial [Polyangia bacterium]|nr:VWA domain-containing protein [Polyangia bacterium]